MTKIYSSDFDFLPYHPLGVLAPQGFRAAVSDGVGLLVSNVKYALTSVHGTSGTFWIGQQNRGVLFSPYQLNTPNNQLLQTLVESKFKKLIMMIPSANKTTQPSANVELIMSKLELAEGEAVGTKLSFCIVEDNTQPKRAVVRFMLNNKICFIGAMCGHGLLYLTSDILATPHFLEISLVEIFKRYWDPISSPHSTFMANGLARTACLGEDAPAEHERIFKAALEKIVVYLTAE